MSVDWQFFLERYWEKEPVQLDTLGTGPVITPAEVFQAMREKSQFGPSDRFWVKHGGEFQKVDLAVFGPRAEDADLNAYLGRLRLSTTTQEMGLNLQSLQASSPTLWFRLRHFVKGLLEQLPLPSQRWDIDCFLGNYRTTPFGIHTDSASVFAFGVLGRRTYYAWPQEYFQSDHQDLYQSDQESWSKHIDHAIRLDLEPGKAIYWPSSHWHVVTSDGSPSLVLQLSAYFGISLARFFGQLVTGLLEKELGSSSCLTLSQSGAELRGALAMLSPDLLSRKLEQAWLARLSADGFVTVPALDRTLQIPDCLHLRQNVRLFTLDLGDQRQLFCNGLSFLVRNEPVVLRILAALEGAQGEGTDRFLARFPEAPALAKIILLGLARRRAFQ